MKINLPDGAITPNRLSVYFALCHYIDLHRRPPSIRELCAMMGRAKNGVFNHLHQLKAMGLLEIEPDTARAYKPLYRVEAV